MQLQKQHRKAHKPRTKTVKLESFNPVMKPGFEIAAINTVHNFSGATHVVVTTQQRAQA